MKIAIIGTRGIPNHYGGFEQFAEYLSQLLVEAGHQVIVYNSHNHPYKESVWNGVQIIHQYDPEDKVGTLGQFIYDLNCIRNLSQHSFDIVLQLGYTSSSVWNFLLPKSARIITNMDGLEWKRSKYNTLVKGFLKFAEKLAVSSSDLLIADSLGIQDYLMQKYQKPSIFIPYGATVADNVNSEFLNLFGLRPFEYDMLIARLEPENNIESILEGLSSSNVSRNFVVIGNFHSPYGRYITNKFTDPRIKYLGGIYDINKLNALRNFSNIYFHGHTVGGTNPSLLEAMASGAFICAHKNIFNSSILGNDAIYFDSGEDITRIVSSFKKDPKAEKAVLNNYKKIKEKYSWQIIFQQYEQVFKSTLNK